MAHHFNLNIDDDSHPYHYNHDYNFNNLNLNLNPNPNHYDYNQATTTNNHQLRWNFNLTRKELVSSPLHELNISHLTLPQHMDRYHEDGSSDWIDRMMKRARDHIKQSKNMQHISSPFLLFSSVTSIIATSLSRYITAKQQDLRLSLLENTSKQLLQHCILDQNISFSF